MTSSSTFACNSQAQSCIDVIVESQSFIDVVVAVILAFVLHSFREYPLKVLQGFLVGQNPLLSEHIDPPAKDETKACPMCTIPEMEQMSDYEELMADSMFNLEHSEEKIEADMASLLGEEKLEATMAACLEEELKTNVDSEVHARMQADLENELLEGLQDDLRSLCDDQWHLEHSEEKIEADVASFIGEEKLAATMAACLEEELKTNVDSEVHARIQADLESELLEWLQDDLQALCDDQWDTDALRY